MTTKDFAQAPKNLANLNDTYVKSAVPDWFPLTIFWNWPFYWFFSKAWVQCGTVTVVIITIALSLAKNGQDRTCSTGGRRKTAK